MFSQTLFIDNTDFTDFTDFYNLADTAGCKRTRDGFTIDYQ